ncbi:hypothetical protein [Bacillus sp. P14.5]|uniref:hypothetical protein n=1 Tax=Bacillus sp. P14.5 TaxID=1983400 RepID=UPI000DE9CA04|nr:hypothetical protein [Bacillus sp. P14.5]
MVYTIAFHELTKNYPDSVLKKRAAFYSIHFLQRYIDMESEKMIFINENKTSWKIENREVHLELENVLCAKYYGISGVMAFIIGDETKNPEKVAGYDSNGKALFTINQPEGYQLMYLTNHPQAEVAVVCGIVDSESESWSDFYFKVNLHREELERIGIAR